jgi:inhibitor of cysteine peptidase
MEMKKWHRAALGALTLVLILALAASAVTGCSSANASQGPVKLGQADSGKAYTVKVGDTIEVVLPGNPTTGFSWIAALADKDAAVLVQQGEPAYVQDAKEGNVVGSGGTYTFTFKATTAGTATLKLVYERTFENVAPEQTFEVQITVE